MGGNPDGSKVIGQSRPSSFFSLLTSNLSLLSFIFLLGFGLRLAYWSQASKTPFYHPLTLDSAAYEEKAAEISSDPHLLPRGVFYQAPFYPYFLALMHGLFGPSLFPIRLIQILLGSLIPVLVYLISRCFFSTSTSLLSAFLSALYGPLLYEDALGDKTTLAVFFFALATWASIKVCQEGKGWLLSGFVWGLGSLLRESFLLIGLVLSIAYGRKKSWQGLLGMVLAILPITLLNLRAGDFVLVTSQGGQNFYVGNSPYASGSYVAPPFVRATPEHEQADFKKEAEARLGRTLKPSEASNYWLSEGLRFVVQKPGRAFSLYLKKALLALNAYEIPDNYNYDFLKRSIPLLRWPLLSFALIGPLALCGLLFAGLRERRKGLSVLYAVLGLYAASLVLFFVVGRYRASLVPLLFPFSAYALTRLVDEALKKKWKGLALAVLFLLIAFVLVNHRLPDYPISRDFSREHYMLGNAYRKAGDLQAAVQEWKSALSERPDYKEALNNLSLAKNILKEDSLRQVVLRNPTDARAHLDYGLVLQDLQKDSLALLEFERALSLDSANAGAWQRLGFFYATRKGDMAKAKEALSRAVSQDSTDASAWLNLGNCFYEVGERKEALACWQKARALRPDDPVLKSNIQALKDLR